MLGMFNFLMLESTWAAIKYDFVSGIYSIVAYVYDIMIELVESGHGSLGEFQFGDITATVYTLAGVFMLFRITIYLLQMLANPDMVSDSQVGGSKLLVRVVLVVVMLMLFFPTGILFDKTDGLFVRVEEALLDEDGLINNIVKISGSDHDWSTSKKKTEAPDPIKDDQYILKRNPLEGYKSNNEFIENVYAAQDPDLSCYYLYVKSHKKENPTGPGQKLTDTLLVSSVYKIGFFKGSGGEKKVAGTDYTYTSYTYRVYGKDEYGNYNKLDRQISKGNVFNSGFPSSCPKSFELNDNNQWKSVKSYPGGVSSVLKCNGPSNSTVNCTNTGFYGYNSPSKMSKAVKSMKRDETGHSYTVDSASHKFVKAIADTNGNTNSNDAEYLKGVRPEAVAFARNALASFQECAIDNCSDIQSEMLTTQEGEQNMRQAIKDEDIKQEFMMAAILGLGLIVYLAFLCVDVVVRKFKLILLEALAPIPVICYIDPKDKIFNQWLKTYLTVFADLFLKLLAIRIGIDLLSQVWKGFTVSYDHNLAKLFYVIGILVFIKAIPDLISSIFGLKMGGSFKDIKSMFGKAAGLGAAAGGAAVGGALGAVAGFASNQGAFHNKLGSAVGGALRGIGSGSKGDIYGGAQSMAKTNAYRNELRESGKATPFNRLFGETKEKMGLSEYQAQKKKLEEEHDEYQKERDKIEKAKGANANAKAQIAKERAALFDKKQEQAKFEGAKAAIGAMEDKAESNLLKKTVYDGKGIKEVEDFRAAQAAVKVAESSGAALIQGAQSAHAMAQNNLLTAQQNLQSAQTALAAADAMPDTDLGAKINARNQAKAQVEAATKALETAKQSVTTTQQAVVDTELQVKTNIQEANIDVSKKQKAAFDAVKQYEVEQYKAGGEAKEGMDKNIRVALDSIESYGYDFDSFDEGENSISKLKGKFTKGIGALKDSIRQDETQIAENEHYLSGIDAHIAADERDLAEKERDLAERERDLENSNAKLIYDEMHDRRK